MAFVKLYQVIQDHALGLQSVNQAADNEQEIQDDWDEEHGATPLEADNSSTLSWWDRLGRHDSRHIPRAIASVIVRTSGAGIYLPELEIASSSGILSGIRREQTGVYFIPYLTQWQHTWAEGAPSGSATVPRQVVARHLPQATGQEPGFIVYLHDHTSGWAAADYSFSIAIFGSVDIDSP